MTERRPRSANWTSANEEGDEWIKANVQKTISPWIPLNSNSAAFVIKTAMVGSNWKNKGNIMENLPDSFSRVWGRWTDSGQ